MALRLIYQMFTKLLSWIVLRTQSDTTKEELGVGFATFARIWRNWGLRPWRVETFKFSTDPELEDRRRRPGRGPGARPGRPHRLARPHLRAAGARRLPMARTRPGPTAPCSAH
jgi:hypothetical protein